MLAIRSMNRRVVEGKIISVETRSPEMLTNTIPSSWSDTTVLRIQLGYGLGDVDRRIEYKAPRTIDYTMSGHAEYRRGQLVWLEIQPVLTTYLLDNHLTLHELRVTKIEPKR